MGFLGRNWSSLISGEDGMAVPQGSPRPWLGAEEAGVPISSVGPTRPPTLCSELCCQGQYTDIVIQNPCFQKKCFKMTVK